MELLPLVCLCLLSCSGDAVRVDVKEGSDAVLPCLISNKENLEGKLFDWRKDGSPTKKEVFMYDAGIHYNNGRTGQDQQFKGRVSFFQDQLQNGNASIKIIRTKMADSGTYSCDFPRLQSQTFIIELVVDQVLRDRTGEKPGAAPEPIVKTLEMTKDRILLQCEAHGVPPLTAEWKDGAGTILKNESAPKSQTGSPSYITLEITVTKTDNYSCVATQEDISHQIAAYTSLYIHDAASETVIVDGWSGWSVVGAAVGAFLAVGVLLAVLHFKGCITLTCSNGSRRNTTNGPTDTELTSTMIRQSEALSVSDHAG